MAPTLQSNLESVRARVASAAARTGRRPEEIALVAVTKSVEPSLAAELCRLGQIDLGESRASELERKDDHLRSLGLSPRWHYVGRLQRNKVRRVVARAASIHSIDSVRLLEAVDRAAGEIGARVEIWIQAKLADEPTKSGLSSAEVPAVFERAREMRNVAVAGLMTLGPFAPGAPGAPAAARDSSARAVFRELARLAADLASALPIGDAAELARVRTSMGMSGDFETAIEEGSDVVRIGTLLFEGLCDPARGPLRSET